MELLLKVDKAVGVDEPCVHLDCQVVALEQPELVFFILEAVDTLLYFLDAKLLQG